MTRKALAIRNTLKSLLFVAVSVAATWFMASTFITPVSGDSENYTVEFNDAEGLIVGNAAQVSGVRVGKVVSVDTAETDNGHTLARVRVELGSGFRPTSSTRAHIRYGDMLGARYVSFTESAGGQQLPANATIGLDRTESPLDLTALMNGFKPLFDTLPPDQVNMLARTVTETFNGQGNSVATLLQRVADLGARLTESGPVFTQLLANTATVMQTVSERSPQINELITGLGQLTSSVVANSSTLVDLISNGGNTIRALTQVMTSSVTDYQQALQRLDTTTSAWQKTTPEFTEFLTKLPQFASKVNAMSQYGGFQSLYLCTFNLKAFAVEANLFGGQHSPICQ